MTAASSTERFEPDPREFTRESTRRMLAAADEIRTQLAEAETRIRKDLVTRRG
ncbi:MAG: hypothetical protein IPP87_19715 [Ideonella sp.]|nr:hypothetical protein [Ideonella sp.]